MRTFAPQVEQGLAECIRSGGAFCALNPPGAAAAHLAWSLWQQFRVPFVWVADGPRSLDRFHRDLVSLAGEGATDIAYYPAWEALPGHGAPPHADLVGDRFDALQRLLALSADGQHATGIIVTCIQALMQRTVTPGQLRDQARELRAGLEIELEELMATLERAGFAVQMEVHTKGEAARRGGILDLWPSTSDWPVRVEFFGSTIESLRTFDPATQASQQPIPALRLAPAEEKPDDLQGTFADFVPARLGWAWLEQESIEHHAALYEEVIREAYPGQPSGSPDPSTGPDRTEADSVPPQEEPEDDQASIANAFTVPYAAVRAAARGPQVALVLTEAVPGSAHRLGYEPFEGTPEVRGSALQPDLLEEQRRRTMADLCAKARAGWTIAFYFGTTGARDRFAESYGRQLEPPDHFTLRDGALSGGFLCPSARLLVAAEEDFYGRRKQARGRYDLHAERPGPRRRGERIAAWTDLQPGDFVVHVDHGIGKYLGLYEIEFAGQRQEALSIEYAEKARLHLPVSQAHLLTRYTGMGGGRPELHALGGKRWDREKEAAQQAVQDLAAQLLQTQAARDALPGHAFAPDNAWQHEFEASFPYAETPDQERAILEVKRDLESPRPMDRLVCGDVGYGKTEVALRAAFKCIMDGKQVALLVPTTILAQQHFDTFTARMAAYPVRIEMLTRFQTRGEQNAIVRAVNEGEVDLVIGTHRLLQGDLTFKDPGLLIVDEEQRFGVAHKEHFKGLRRMIDVLTLTATPIPRTLYLSLTGAKDLSTIETPPMERLPVDTIVSPASDEVVREAILRELNREGQVYFLHNRVQSIYREQERLQKLVPEARLEVAHGQMEEDQLAAVMRSFVRGEFDVLLCTTIIESGLDIPNVNTILIDRADRFGLAELYQLRGRVGRYKHKAYAYFLLPRHGQLLDEARKRINAIRRYSHLGAGFRLALRDLEIRGAGNLLGRQQSGHIAAVGFDLYCQLLKRTVAGLKGEPLPPVIDCDLRLDFIDLSPTSADEQAAAAIPAGYVEDENLRLRTYRDIASATSPDELQQLEADLKDRCGRLPSPLRRLFALARLRMDASRKGIRKIEVEEDKVMMTRNGDFITFGNKFPRLKTRRPSERIEELLKLVNQVRS